jgi:dTDP-4-dehydrorhamnose reductase
LLRAPSVPPLLHLGGPERISRAAWATIIADRLGVAPDLVVSEPRANGRYADRPANSCLSSRLLASHPSTAAIRVRGVRGGTTTLVDHLAVRT